jgi:hypothetical protein
VPSVKTEMALWETSLFKQISIRDIIDTKIWKITRGYLEDEEQRYLFSRTD